MHWRRAASLLSLLPLLACRPSAPEDSEATDNPEPAAASEQGEQGELAALLLALDDPLTRASALVELERLSLEIDGRDDAEAREQTAERLLPALADLWPEAAASERATMLRVADNLAAPQAEALWRRALSDFSLPEDSLAAALSGIVRARARSLSAAIATHLGASVDAGFEGPQGEPDAGHVAKALLLIHALGQLHASDQAERLIMLLESGGDFPIEVQRELVSTLGQLGDPLAAEPLLVAMFRVPDFPGIQSLGERAVRALGAIGEPALPAVLDAYAGHSPRLAAVAEEHGIGQALIQMTAVQIMGVIGSADAVPTVVAHLSASSCERQGKNSAAQIRASYRRATAARTLGQIADPRGAAPLCACADSREPSEVSEIAQALGRIAWASGPNDDEALGCLERMVATASLDPELVSAGTQLDIRGEALRWLVLASEPDQAPSLRATLEQAAPEVRAHVREHGADQGIAVLEACADQRACYAERLADASQPAHARELAAFQLARLSQPGDLETAATLAQGFAIPDAEVRISVAWLSARLAGDQPCPACADALETVMTKEATNSSAAMQAAWVTARRVIDELRARE
ncbi:hypothetical protein G6O69_35745 [Pseudenhygromyxa sp. WMMC2535]|uniref:HEAT repeat domain-containing protein n=1 Tax=Pseudenhygromyxa sp. WMMC2535 TaxID=2712867 RepID=UPI0015579EFB|nr:hypothetical protein [Pseudenhygromyxa sp. WMMC2535]NVB43233.1 hypothetical protein [Pseudenhygromyxa sp. WMMC2535]